ncbi:MAG: helix-turn-helix domain-containing protein [Chloroflexota bacterium]
MTTADAAKFLGLTPDHIAKLCSTGKLEAKRHGPVWNISPESLEVYKGIIDSKRINKPRSPNREKTHTRNRKIDNKIFAIFEEMRAIELINQISVCLQSQDPVMVLNAAPLLVNLLLDKPPVVSFLVDDHSTRLRFKVGRVIPQSVIDHAPPSQHLLIQDSFDPFSSKPVDGYREVNLPEFLAQNILFSAGKALTVGGLIISVSNVISHSQLHQRLTRDDVLRQVSHQICSGGITPVLRLFRAIGKVIFRGIDPYLDNIPLLSVMEY